MTPTVALPSLDARRYAETFGVFLEHSREYTLMVDELVRVIHAHVPPGFRMLDIGAGTGCLIRSLAERPDVKLARYAAYEPNPRHVEALRAVLAQLPVPSRLHPEGYSEATRIEGCFDLVLFSHSLYWMPDPAGALMHAAESLAPGGIAIALLQGPYGVHALFHLFEDHYRRLTPMLQNNRMSSHELVAGLRARGVEPEVRMLKTAMDLTGLFDACHADALSEFISFLLQLEFGSLPQRLQQDIIQYIEGGCVIAGDKLLWYLPNASVVVRRAAIPAARGQDDG